MKSYLTSLVVLLSVCASAPAQAQTRSMRPYKALFGGATNNPSVRHSLDLSVSVAEGYDDNVLANGGGLGANTGTDSQLSGLFTNIDPGLTYAWTGKTVQFSAFGSTSVRYYQKDHQFLGSTFYGAIGLSAGAERTRFTFTQSVNYSPAYFYGLFPSFMSSDVVDTVTTVGAGSDYAVNSDSVLVYETSANLTRSLTSRSTFNLLGTFRYSDLSQIVGGQDLQAYSAGGRYLQPVAQRDAASWIYLSGRSVHVRRQRAVDRRARHRCRRRLPQAVVVFTPHARRLQRRFVVSQHADL